jgi:hypothetical protein
MREVCKSSHCSAKEVAEFNQYLRRLAAEHHARIQARTQYARDLSA